MKIFLISNMYPSVDDPDYGIFVKNIESALEKNGAVISEKAVISGRAKSSTDKIIKYRKFYSKIISAYRKGNFDIVYLHFISHSSPGLLLAKILFGKKKKIIINIHGSDVLSHHKGILKKCNQQLLKFSDLIVVPSHYFEKIIYQKFPDFPKNKIFISPSGGIDSTVFYFQNKSKSNEVLHLGFVSRIEDDKGWKTFLEALMLLNSNSIPFKASLAGKGSKSLKMIKLISGLNLSEKVKFIGVLPQKELNNFYNNIDLFIFPTLSNESLGLVGLEAMACGNPVIGSEIAGLKTFIENNKNGFFIKPGNAQELAEKIEKYWLLPQQEKQKIQRNALKTAQKYEKELVAQKLYHKFKELISQT